MLPAPPRTGTLSLEDETASQGRQNASDPWISDRVDRQISDLFFFFLIININIQLNLYTPQLILQILKLIII
jgi:hypothetical protein